jgi:hypothetical protein
MIAAIRRIEAAATKALGRIADELLTLQPRGGGTIVRGTIDRTNRSPDKYESEINTQGDVGVTIYIQKRYLTAPPKAGEYFEETNGDTHIVGDIKDLGDRWQVFCSSEPL